MESTPFELPRTGLGGSISNAAQLLYPPDHPRARVFMPDLPMTWADFRQYDFDPNAEVLFALHLMEVGRIPPDGGGSQWVVTDRPCTSSSTGPEAGSEIAPFRSVGATHRSMPDIVRVLLTVLVALAVVALAGVAWAAFKFRGLLRYVISEVPTPSRITLEPDDDAEWAEMGKVDADVRAFREAGLVDVGPSGFARCPR